MYTPARSDLVALAIAVLVVAALARLVESSTSVALTIPALLAIPATPAAAAWLSGPAHSLKSRFLYRGVLAVAGMAAVIVSAGARADADPATFFIGIIVALPTAALAFILLLITDAIVRLQGNPDGS